MPSYYYVIRNRAFENGDEDGTTLRDDREAQIYALRIIRELKEGGGYDDDDWTVTVFAEGGRQICTVPFSTLPAVRLARQRGDTEHQAGH